MPERQIARKRDTGEAGNAGQFGSLSRSEADLDLTTISDEDLTGAIDEMDLDELEFDLDGDGIPDGDLDIIRTGATITLEGTVTQHGKSRQVSEELGDVRSYAQLRAELIAGAQRIAAASPAQGA